jgi:hypothetical protein
MAINHPVVNFRPANVGGQEPFTTSLFYGNDVLATELATRGLGADLMSVSSLKE